MLRVCAMNNEPFLYDDESLRTTLYAMNIIQEEKDNPYGMDRKKPFNTLKSIQEFDQSTINVKALDFEISQFNAVMLHFKDYKVNELQLAEALASECEHSNAIESIYDEREHTKLAEFYTACSNNESQAYQPRFIEDATASWGLKTHGVRKRVKGKRVRIASGHHVKYTPPEGKLLIMKMLKDWDEFNRSPDAVSPIISIAMSHYQYETIHPLWDGNGRTGRAFAVDMFKSAYNTNVSVPVSKGLYSDRQSYYRALDSMRLKGQAEPLVKLFLEAFTDGMVWVMDNDKDNIGAKTSF